MLAEIFQIASEFRAAIEQSDRAKLPASFAEFPRGSSYDAALLLGTHLLALGYEDVTQKSGLHPSGGYPAHAWLEVAGSIVDITADQFIEISEPVIVQSGSAWHEAFDDIQVEIEDYRDLDAASVGTFGVYHAIIAEKL